MSAFCFCGMGGMYGCTRKADGQARPNLTNITHLLLWRQVIAYGLSSFFWGKKKWCSEEIMGLVNCPCRLYVACVWFGQCWWSVPSSNAVTYSICNALLIALLSLVLGIHPCLAGGFMLSSWRNFWGANSSSRWAGIWYRGVRSEHAEQLSIGEMIAVLRAPLAGQSLAALPGL